ncbi:MAG: indole-3-glycerol phosphate synthase TrpC [Candidatus Symbiothrix sp.]|jgi:indole-3-glycerol phosphate synthase|nr:indole-3-glycerol phosphate synthase TrpC [Candidatus Symbiothrix sp.]
MNILETICVNKRLEVEQQKQATSLVVLQRQIAEQKRAKLSFKAALQQSATGIIAEFKRQSPSKGLIHPGADVAEIVSGYENVGAAAISVLTDNQFFGGSFDDFQVARRVISKIPLLRKDFIVDEYQIYQSKALGADVILLIAACLTPDEVARFSTLAHELDLEVLLEIHNADELAYIRPTIDVVGINNRDLKTFTTDIRHTIELANQLPDGFVRISESGLSTPETVLQLRQAGFQGFLMGETFMKTDNPAQTLRAFNSSLRLLE